MKKGCSFLKRRFSEAGAAMVEFAVSAPIFLLVVLGGLEVSLASYQSSAMQYTLATALRTGILSTSFSIPDRTNFIKSQIAQIGTRYGLQLAPTEIKICSASSIVGQPNLDPNCPIESAGNPRDFIMVKVDKSTTLLFGRYPIHLQSTVVAINEPA